MQLSAVFLQNMSWKSLIIVDNAQFQFPPSPAELSTRRELTKRQSKETEYTHAQHNKEKEDRGHNKE